EGKGVGNGAQDRNAIIDEQGRDERAATDAVGGEAKAVSDGATAGRKRTVVHLNGRNRGDSTGGLQGSGDAGGVGEAGVAQRERNGNSFTRVNGAVCRQETFRSQRRGGEDDSRSRGDNTN